MKNPEDFCYGGAVQILEGVRHLDRPLASSVMTIGNFDGVHLGHQALIRKVVDRARKEGVPAVVMTFDPHPAKVLYPERKLHKIFGQTDLFRQMARHGVDYLVVEPFSREFSQLPPEQFLENWIVGPFHPKLIVVGHDFSFGANREGSIEFLRGKSKERGFEVDVVTPVKSSELTVSSTQIRKALEAGDVATAERMLGRRFYVTGLVEKGAGRGRTIGVPTANVRTTAETIPGPGVYAAWAELGSIRWKAAVNVGFNPTFVTGEDVPLNVEAHLIGYSGRDLYGEELTLTFVARLREERKFNGPAELVAQIKRDLGEAERILGEDASP